MLKDNLQPSTPVHYRKKSTSNSSPDIFFSYSDCPKASYLMKFSQNIQKRNMKENSFRDVVCKFRQFTFLIREKSIYDYFNPEFMRKYKIERKNLYVSEIWNGKSTVSLRGDSLSAFVVVLPRLELVEKLIRNYLDWSDQFECKKETGKYWNDCHIFEKKQDGDLKSVFTNTLFELEEGEFVEKISDNCDSNITFLTNFGHFFHLEKEIVKKSEDLFTGLAVGGSFWIGWSSRNLLLFGNLYFSTKNTKIDIPNEIEHIDDVSCGWDNVFIVANSRKDLFGFGRNFGSFFKPAHESSPDILQISLKDVKLPEESIQKVTAADGAALVLLDSGNLIINKFALSKSPLFVFYSDITKSKKPYNSKLWVRVHSETTLQKYQDSRIIDIDIGRSHICTLSLNNIFSIYSLNLKLEQEFYLCVPITMDYPLFVLNSDIVEVNNSSDCSKRIIVPSYHSSFFFRPKVICGEESAVVWYHAFNPVDLFQSDYRRMMISNRFFSDLELRFSNN